MKLIDEKEIENAAKNHSIFENSQRYDCEKLYSFIEGVEFAEQKLIPLMIEFVEFSNTFQLYGKNYCPVGKTTKQLLKQFIKNKQDEKA